MPLLDFLPTDGVMTDLSASSKKQLIENIAEPVSYTHLTLPTILLV